MINIIRIGLLATAFVIGGILAAKAQQQYKSLECGVGASGFLYQGDLSGEKFGSRQDMRYGFSLHGKYLINKSWAIRGDFYQGKLAGNDRQFTEEWRQKRAYQFSSPLSELSVAVEFSLTGNNAYRSYTQYGAQYRRWRSGIYAGVGVAKINSSRNWQHLDRHYFGKDATAYIPLDSMSAPAKWVLVIPAGVSLSYAATERLSVFADIGYRFTFTDNMDGYRHSVYSRKKDGYSTYTLGLSYKLPSINRQQIKDVFKERWYK